jgi:Response regulator containing a CheY-like receiver domain and an HTH DNA-binding domain
MNNDPRAAAQSTINVMLVDDQPLIRRGLRTLIEIETDMQVVAEAANGIEALAMVEKHSINVALIDAQMPHMGGIELIEQLCNTHPEIATLILTTFDDEAILTDSLRAGAGGHLLKDVDPEELLTAIRQAHAGRTVLGSMASQYLVENYIGKRESGPIPVDTTALSERETTVAKHISQGHTNREIARAMFISEGTVKNHVSAILRKLNLRDRIALAIYLQGRD